jgi:hypothetical protein
MNYKNKTKTLVTVNMFAKIQFLTWAPCRNCQFKRSRKLSLAIGWGRAKLSQVSKNSHWSTSETTKSGFTLNAADAHSEHHVGSWEMLGVREEGRD